MLKFRPHHFMCTLGFEGMGYSANFVDNYHSISQMLQSAPLTKIKIVASQDDICKACPHIDYKQGCNSYTKVNYIDQQHLGILGFKVADIVTWQQAKDQIKLKMTTKKFKFACASCEWQVYGVCEKALIRLQNSN